MDQGQSQMVELGRRAFAAVVVGKGIDKEIEDSIKGIDQLEVGRVGSDTEPVKGCKENGPFEFKAKGPSGARGVSVNTVKSNVTHGLEA
jgi:hypothetical protein